MTRRYSAFMVRCWHLASGEQRYAVEDIQTGAAVRVPSLNEAFEWLALQSREPPAEPGAKQPSTLERASTGEQADRSLKRMLNE
jgi:hypothetical protein